MSSLLGSQLTSQMTPSLLPGAERDSKATKGGVRLRPRYAVDEDFRLGNLGEGAAAASLIHVFRMDSSEMPASKAEIDGALAAQP